MNGGPTPTEAPEVTLTAKHASAISKAATATAIPVQRDQYHINDIVKVEDATGKQLYQIKGTVQVNSKTGRPTKRMIQSYRLEQSSDNEEQYILISSAVSVLTKDTKQRVEM